MTSKLFLNNILTNILIISMDILQILLKGHKRQVQRDIKPSQEYLIMATKGKN